jgi:hypothetical protein
MPAAQSRLKCCRDEKICTKKRLNMASPTENSPNLHLVRGQQVANLFCGSAGDTAPSGSVWGKIRFDAPGTLR